MSRKRLPFCKYGSRAVLLQRLVVLSFLSDSSTRQRKRRERAMRKKEKKGREEERETKEKKEETFDLWSLVSIKNVEKWNSLSLPLSHSLWNIEFLRLRLQFYLSFHFLRKWYLRLWWWEKRINFFLSLPLLFLLFFVRRHW